MAKVQDIVEMHRNIAESLGKRMTDIVEKIKSTSSSEMGKPNLDKLQSDYNDFKSSVWNILELLKSLIQNVAAQVDDVDNKTRRNALLFSGIEEKEGENLISTILSTVQVLMGLSDVQSTAIQHCHRLGARSDKRHRPILARFNNLNVRNLIFNNKKSLKASPVVLSGFLTKPRQDLFARAKKHFGLAKCWTRYGAVFIKLPNNEVQRVNDSDHFEDLMLKHPSIFPHSPSIPVAIQSKTDAAVAMPQRKVTPASSSKINTRPVTRKQVLKKP